MFVICLPMTPREDRATVQVGNLIAQAVIDAGMNHKEAWLAYGDRDGSRWTRALQGQQGYSVDLWRLVQLPPRFWMVFAPALMKALVAYWFREFLEDADVLRRASAVDSARVAALVDVGRARPARAELVPKAVDAHPNRDRLVG